MNMFSFSRKFFSLHYILVFAFGLLLVASCKKDTCEPPVIDFITENGSAESIVDLIPTHLVVLRGSNLDDLVSIIINDSVTLLRSAGDITFISSDTAVFFRVPVIETNDPNTEMSDFIRATKRCGQDRISINLLAAPPYIRKISNEYALPGETITVEGLYFDELYPDSVIVPSGATGGTILPDYTDTLCQVILPDANLGSGELFLVSQSGRGASRTSVELYPSSGLISNFDDLNTFTGNSERVINPDDYSNIPATNGNIFYAEFTNLQPGAAADDAMQMALDITTNFEYSGALSPQFFALKLEMFVKEAWESGYFDIEIGHADAEGNKEYAYTMQYNPLSDTTLNGTFTTDGWETVWIPITSFKLEGTSNTYLQSFAQIRTINYMNWTFHNQNEENGGKVISNLGIGIDNIRLAQITASSL